MVLYYVSVAAHSSLQSRLRSVLASSVLLARPPSRSPGAKAAAAENQGEFGPTRDSYSSGSRFMVHPISDLYTLLLLLFRGICFPSGKTERSRRSSSRSRERARARRERQRGVPPVLVLVRCATMVKLTMIVRLFDGLPLCESLELDKIANLEMYKQQAKVSACFRARTKAKLSTSALPFKESRSRLKRRLT